VTVTAELTPAASPARHTSPPVSWHDRLVTPLPDDRLRGWLVTLGIGLFAGFLRFWHLGSLLWTTDPTDAKRPAGYYSGSYVDKTTGCVRYYQDIFDETYYHHDALSLLKHGVEQNCQNTGAGFVVHPPLGKWMIGAGIHLFGDNPFGWRAASATVGTLAVIIMVRLARRLFSSTLLGGFAGLVFALDGMEFVLSRIGILDIFVMFFELVALATLLLDREHGRRLLAAKLDRGAATSYPGPRLGFRYWRVLTGVFLGAALAVKWSGLYVIPAYAALAFAWDVGARRLVGIPRPVRAAIRRDWLGWVPQFTALPIGIYTATWTGWFAGGSNAWDRTNVSLHGENVSRTGFVGSIQNWLAYQCNAYNFHKNLTDNNHTGDGSYLIPGINFCKTDTAVHDPGKLHPYLSKPLGWLFLSRPVSFYYQSPTQGQANCDSKSCSKEILCLGTPAIWWVSAAALVVVAGVWMARRDWRAAMIIVVFAMGFFPWMLDESRQMFIFYAIPLLPAIVLAITMVAGLILGRPDAGYVRRRSGGIAVGGYATLVAVNFFWLYPLFVGTTMSFSSWNARMWFPGWV
jgi:dolichyl-phosphate-mannose-protein mannosyltransferase